MARAKLPIITIFLIISVVCIALFFYQRNSAIKADYYTPIPLATHSNGKHFVGSDSCMECHLDSYASHLKTAHYQTSARADTSTIRGSFKKGKNIYQLNEEVAFNMVTENDGLFQEVHSRTNNKQISKSKINVVIGSGTKGQSYLTWSNDSLYQLQLSYFTPNNSWANSPGFPFEIIANRRPVNAKCMECHTTFAKATSLYGMENTYDQGQLLYGIDCERCHGPSEEHVSFHRKNPQIVEAKYMMVYDTLSRQQRLDACALCHSGLREDIKPAFQFVAGETLTDYSLPDASSDSLQNIDVHGNQYALLTNSKCFTQSEMMDCITCHDPHKNQRDQTSFFNGKCMECHNQQRLMCSVDTHKSVKNDNNCIACHMPLEPSKTMFMENGIDTLKSPVLVRTHLIDIYVAQMENKQSKP